MVYAQAVRQAELYARFFQQVVHNSLELVAGLVVADGCATDQVPLVASMIVAQARGPQFDLLATVTTNASERGFALPVELIVQLKRTWR